MAEASGAIGLIKCLRIYYVHYYLLMLLPTLLSSTKPSVDCAFMCRREATASGIQPGMARYVALHTWHVG